MSHNTLATSHCFITFDSGLVSGIVEEDATVSQSDAFDGVSLSDLSLGMLSLYTVKPVLRGHPKKTKIDFQYRLSLNADQKYC